MNQQELRQADPQVAAAIGEELGRQRHKIELIASENFVSPAVMEAMGTVLTNKYAEGYPGHRYYGGHWCYRGYWRNWRSTNYNHTQYYNK